MPDVLAMPADAPHPQPHQTAGEWLNSLNLTGNQLRKIHKLAQEGKRNA